MNIKEYVLDRLFSTEYKVLRIPWGIASGLQLNLRMRSEFHWYFGIYEFEVTSHFKRLLKQTETFLDIGSADGIYAACALKSPTMKRIIAVDMDPLNIPRIQMNLNLNSSEVEKIIVCKKVSDQDSKIEVTLKSLLVNPAKKTLIKLDVEGAEAIILKSSHALLINPNICWIIETHGKEVEVQCLDLIKELNRSVKVIKKNFLRRWIKEGRSSNHNQWLIVE